MTNKYKGKDLLNDSSKVKGTVQYAQYTCYDYIVECPIIIFDDYTIYLPNPAEFEEVRFNDEVYIADATEVYKYDILRNISDCEVEYSIDKESGNLEYITLFYSGNEVKLKVFTNEYGITLTDYAIFKNEEELKNMELYKEVEI